MAKDKTKQLASKRDEIKPGGFRVQKAKASELPKSFLLYGRPKVGKSSIAASIADVYSKVLCIDIDDGAGGFAHEYPDIDVVNFRRGDVLAFESYWRDLVRNDGHGYDAVILDTLSILQQWKFNATSKGDGYERYNVVALFANEIMWELHTMSPVGIATLHVEMANTVRGSENKDYVQLVPSLIGKVSKMQLPAIPDVIGFLDAAETEEGVERTLTLQPSDDAVTGNRFRALPYALADPTMERIYSIIRNGGVD